MTTLRCKLIDDSGSSTGELPLDPEVFARKVSTAQIYDTVRWQLTKRRAGTHSVLTKGVMKGGGRKPWRQKGTGRARAGSNTSPVWVGGAVAHGPKPHKYDNRTMRRVRSQSLIAAIADKAKSDAFVCFNSLTLESHKASALSALLKKGKVTGKNVVMLFNENIASPEVQNAWRACGNLKGVIRHTTKSINPYDVIKGDILVSTKSAVEELQTRLKSLARLNPVSKEK